MPYKPAFPNSDELLAQVRLRQALGRQRLANITTDMLAGTIMLGEWQTDMKDELQDLYAQAVMLGTGGSFDDMDDGDWGDVSDALASQYDYLADFAAGIAEAVAAGLIMSEDYYTNRAEMYTEGAESSFWRAMRQTATDKADGVIVWWQTMDNKSGEHCDDCIALEDGSPYQANTFDQFPGDGDTECSVRCTCKLHFEVPTNGDDEGE